MKPFLFARGTKNYARFLVPAHLQAKLGKRFLVFALGSGAGHELRLKAHQIEHQLTTQLLQNGEMDIPNINKLDIVFSNGTQLKNINTEDDLRRAKELLQTLQALHALQAVPAPTPIATPIPTTLEAPKPSKDGLKLMGLVDKFFLLKSQLKPATAQAYKNCIQEFQQFLKNPNVTDVLISDVTRFQEHLANNKNSTRTIDNKTSIIRALFNFAIKQGYFFEKNPAEDRALLTKKQRIASGFEKFTLEEIDIIFNSSEFKKEKEKDPDFYFVCVLALVSGCRISELTSLLKTDFKKTEKGTTYIRVKDAKTQAGNRSVPYPENLANIDEFLKNKTNNVFKYVAREGKGSGNAVGKKFTRLLETLRIKRDKLVFHSLRKFLNDYLLKNDVQYEPRCQFIGHEIDDTNVAIYSKEYTEDELFKYVKEHQENLIIRCKL